MHSPVLLSDDVISDLRNSYPDSGLLLNRDGSTANKNHQNWITGWSLDRDRIKIIMVASLHIIIIIIIIIFFFFF